MSTVYLVTGANRGIGFGIVEGLSTRKDSIIYATARNPQSATELNQLAAKHDNIRVLQLDALNVDDNRAVAQTIKDQVGRIDVLFANAGLSKTPSSVINDSPELFMELFNVNTVGVVNLFQATYKLLEASTREEGGVFFAVSTLLASFAEGLPSVLGAAYGASKAALNHLVKRISYEHKDIIALAVHPGLVKTPIGDLVGEGLGVANLSDIGGIEVATSAAGQIKVADAATKESSGSYLDYTGRTIGW